MIVVADSSALPPPACATTIRVAEVSFALPRKISMPLPFNNAPTPPVSCFTTLFLRSTSQSQRIFGSPTSMPYSLARLICS